MDATRYERYGDLTNDSGHVVAKLDGITDSDLEWSLTGAVEHTEISLGHIGLTGIRPNLTWVSMPTNHWVIFIDFLLAWLHGGLIWM
jgi:hypothetical protein